MDSKDTNKVKFNEVEILKEHMKLILTYVKSLEASLEKMEENQNNMGDNISNITNKLLDKINSENKTLKNDIKTLLLYLQQIDNNEQTKDYTEIDKKIEEMNENNDFVIKAVENNKKYVDSLTKNLKKVAKFIKESSSVKLYKKLETELEKIRYEYSCLNSYNALDASNNVASNLLKSDKIKFNRFYEDLRQLKRNHFELLNTLKKNNETSLAIAKDHTKITEENTYLKKKYNEIESKCNALFNMNNVLRNQQGHMENNFRTILTYVKSLENKVNELTLNKIKQEVENEVNTKISNKISNDQSNKSKIINEGNISLEIKEI